MFYWKKWHFIKENEGDKKTPKGIFSIGNLFYRSDKFKNIETKLKKLKSKKIWDGVMILIIKTIIN